MLHPRHRPAGRGHYRDVVQEVLMPIYLAIAASLLIVAGIYLWRRSRHTPTPERQWPTDDDPYVVHRTRTLTKR